MEPTPVPSPLPSSAPTPLPTPLPSPVPTTKDTVTLTISIAISGNAASLAADPDGLKSSIAASTGIESSKVKNIQLVTTTANTTEPGRRRRLGVKPPAGTALGALDAAAKFRRLADTTTTVSIEFDVVTDLQEEGYQTADSLLAALTSSLDEAVSDGSMTSALSVACNCTVAATSVSLDMAANYPTLKPTHLPSPAPTPAPTPAMCSYTLLACDQVVTDNNYHHGSFVGGDSGETNFLILAQDPVRAHVAQLHVPPCAAHASGCLLLLLLLLLALFRVCANAPCAAIPSVFRCSHPQRASCHPIPRGFSGNMRANIIGPADVHDLFRSHHL